MKRLWDKIVALAGSNFGLKAVALTIAIGLWLAGHRDTERAIEVPVEFHSIPADLMVMENRVDYVVLRVMGPRTLISTLDADRMRLSLDLHDVKSGSLSFPLTADHFNIPRGVSVARITPPVIHLKLEPVATRTLPVAVRLSGAPEPGYRISSTRAQPETVSVHGPADEVRRLTAIETVPVDVEKGRGAIKRRVRLSSEGKPLALTPDQVEVTIAIEEEHVVRDFERIEVHALDFKGVYRVTPPTVALRLSGPKSTMDKLQLEPQNVHLDLEGVPAGEHEIPLTFNLPAGVTVVEQKPQRFRVRIVKSKA